MVFSLAWLLPGLFALECEPYPCFLGSMAVPEGKRLHRPFGVCLSRSLTNVLSLLQRACVVRKGFFFSNTCRAEPVCGLFLPMRKSGCHSYETRLGGWRGSCSACDLVSKFFISPPLKLVLDVLCVCRRTRPTTATPARLQAWLQL